MGLDVSFTAQSTKSCVCVCFFFGRGSTNHQEIKMPSITLETFMYFYFLLFFLEVCVGTFFTLPYLPVMEFMELHPHDVEIVQHAPAT